MGIDNNFLRLLSEATTRGVSLACTATLGRQNVFRLTIPSLIMAFSRCGYSLTEQQASDLLHDDGIYADGLLHYLGANTLESFDYSDYENATHTVDMNRPLDPRYHGRYTALLDGGTLEHIFNFPQAIANCMQMVALNGHFITFCPANNFFGHGFYQFSAELFFRVLSPDNGFVTERVVLVEDNQEGHGWFEVCDPAVARERVTLMSATPCHLYVQARKVSETVPFACYPYQSDYVTIWEKESLNSDRTAPQTIRNRLRNLLKCLLPHSGKEWLRQQLFPGPRSRPDHFKKVL